MRSITITKKDKPLSFNEIEAVQFVSQFLEVSEYEVFQLAFNDWYGKRMAESTMDYPSFFQITRALNLLKQ